MTKALVLLSFCAAISAGMAAAAPMACLSGSLSSYTALTEGCTVNSVTFAGFAVAGSQGTLIPPGSVLVTPLATPGAVGFRFDLNQTAGAGDVLGILINYTVSFAQSASIALNGSSVTPDGANTGILDLCSGSFPAAGPSGCTGTVYNALAADAGFFSQLTDQVNLPPGAYDVFVDLTADGGQAGAATFASASVLHGVPEPATWMALSLGLSLLAWQRRWRPAAALSNRGPAKNR
jgi:hypothetical protein